VPGPFAVPARHPFAAPGDRQGRQAHGRHRGHAEHAVHHRAGEKGRGVAHTTPSITELVKKGGVSAIKEAIVASSERGVQSFDVALLNLYKQNRIDLEEALANADSRSTLEAKINFG